MDYVLLTLKDMKLRIGETMDGLKCHSYNALDGGFTVAIESISTHGVKVDLDSKAYISTANKMLVVPYSVFDEYRIGVEKH